MTNVGDWGAKLKDFFESPQCREIYSYLRERTRQGKVVLPSWQNTFRAFEKTPLRELKVIFLLSDPYPWRKNGKDVADGIALSCGITKQEQPSLSLFYDGMQDDLGIIKRKRNPDLSYLCKQGVLFLNTSLTVEEGLPGSHSHVRVKDKRVRLWEPFMKYFLEMVYTDPQGL